MKYLSMVNTKKINTFIKNIVIKGGYIVSVKGKAPKEVYSDYSEELVTWPVNVAWVDPATGNRVEIVYA